MDKTFTGRSSVLGITEDALKSEMPRLTNGQRWRAIGMVQSGMLPLEIAAHFGCSVVTIRNLRRRHDATGSVADRPRSGRSRVTARRQDRHILLDHLRDRWLPASSTAVATVGTHRRPISGRTVRRHLTSHGLRARRPYPGPILSVRNRMNRFQWVQQHLRWTYGQWNRALFTDKSRFCVSVADGRRRVWRRREVLRLLCPGTQPFRRCNPSGLHSESCTEHAPPMPWVYWSQGRPYSLLILIFFHDISIKNHLFVDL